MALAARLGQCRAMTDKQINPDWVAVDAGAEGLRAWAMQGGRAVAQVQQAGSNARDLTAGGLRPALQDLTAGWQLGSKTPVVICGPLEGGAAALRAVPCTPLGESLPCANDTASPLYPVPGLRQKSPADVMQGGETRIAGFLALNPGWDGVICLTGPHSIWAEVSAGEVVSFQSFMSGELVTLLREHSTLRPALAQATIDMADFGAAVSDSLSRPERLAARLLAIRSGHLSGSAAEGAALAQLNGLLIGAELAAARPYWLGQNLALIGAPEQTRLYAAALEAQGAPATVAEAARMALAGLTAAYRLAEG